MDNCVFALSELEMIEIENDHEMSEFPDIGFLIGAIETEKKQCDLKINENLTESEIKLINGVIGKHYLESDVEPIQNDYCMKIGLTNDTPVRCGPRRLSYYERTEVQKMINELMKDGKVKPSNSPYASAIVLVRKKNGEMRLCIDYRALNKITIKHNFPIPVIEDCIEYFNGKEYFSTLDLKDGYHHIKIHEDSIPLTSFVTPFGQYEFTKMPFGLKNAPAVFQRYILMKLQPLIERGWIVVYMDDISIATIDLKTHVDILTEVLKILREAGLYLNLKKCKFGFTELVYLGYKINEEGIHPSGAHIEAIRKYPMPKTYKVERCNGLFSYFHRFVPNFSSIAKPLTDITRGEKKFVWTNECTKAFEILRDKLLTAPVLAIYDPKKDTEIHCDASSHGFGASLTKTG